MLPVSSQFSSITKFVLRERFAEGSNHVQERPANRFLMGMFLGKADKELSQSHSRDSFYWMEGKQPDTFYLFQNDAKGNHADLAREIGSENRNEMDSLIRRSFKDGSATENKQILDSRTFLA
jgi:hypothetical protein